MTIYSEIARLRGALASAYDAVSAKGGTLPEVRDFSNLPAAIDTIGQVRTVYARLTYIPQPVTFYIPTQSFEVTDEAKIHKLMLEGNVKQGSLSTVGFWNLSHSVYYPSVLGTAMCSLDTSFIDVGTLEAFLESWPPVSGQRPTFYKEDDAWKYDYTDGSGTQTKILGLDDELSSQIGISCWGAENGARFELIYDAWYHSDGGGMEEGGPTFICTTAELPATVGLTYIGSSTPSTNYSLQWEVDQGFSPEDIDPVTIEITDLHELLYFKYRVNLDEWSWEQDYGTIIYPFNGGASPVSNRYLRKIELTDEFPVYSAETVHEEGDSEWDSYSLFTGLGGLQEFIVPAGVVFDLDTPYGQNTIDGMLMSCINLTRFVINTDYDSTQTDRTLCIVGSEFAYCPFLSSGCALSGTGAQSWFDALPSQTGVRVNRSLYVESN